MERAGRSLIDEEARQGDILSIKRDRNRDRKKDNCVLDVRKSV